jgi:hypothetical protein
MRCTSSRVTNNNGDVQTFTDSHDLVDWLKALEIHLTSEGQRSITGSRSLAADTHTPFPIVDPEIADAAARYRGRGGHGQGSAGRSIALATRQRP